MMKAIAFLLCLLSVSARIDSESNTNSEEKSEMLETNRVAKDSTEETFNQEIAESLECDACEESIIKLRDMVKDPANEAKLKQIFNGFCDQLPMYKAECKEFVNAEENNLLKFIIDYLKNSQSVCAQIGLCDANPTFGQELLQLAVSQSQKQLLAHLRSSNDMACDECQFAVTELRSLLQNKDTQTQLKGYVKSLCSVCPYVQQCKDGVDKYWDKAVQLLLDSITDSRQVCVDIGLCSGQSRLVQYIDHVRQNLGRTSIETRRLRSAFRNTLGARVRGYSATCVMCQLGREAVQEILRSSRIMRYIRVAEAQVCDLAGAELGLSNAKIAECRRLIESYGQDILRIITAEAANPRFCVDRMMCTRADAARLEQTPISNTHEVVCEACETTLSVFKYELSDVESEKVIAEEVAKTCAITGPGLFRECKSVVEDVLPGILLRLASFINEDQLCTAAKLCPSTLQNEI